jgi:pimeloyl-ACP methyl ester carboxylesterase
LTFPFTLQAHANGFCKEMWEPFIEEFLTRPGTQNWHIHALDMRGHGNSTTVQTEVVGFDSSNGADTPLKKAHLLILHTFASSAA